LQLLRQHHDAEWFVLSLRELREHERVLVSFRKPNWERRRFSRESGHGQRRAL